MHHTYPTESPQVDTTDNIIAVHQAARETLHVRFLSVRFLQLRSEQERTNPLLYDGVDPGAREIEKCKIDGMWRIVSKRKRITRAGSVH